MSAQAKPLRVAVIGLGMGKNHIRNFNEARDCKVVALCDLNEQLLERVGGEHNVEKTYTSTESLFDDDGFEVVSVATPNTLHHPLTMQALKAGKHVLCEKPMAMNAQLAEEMVREADARDLRLAIHYNHRMTPAVQFIREYADAGELGDIYFARTTWHRRRGIPARPSFLQKANAGGGCLIDLGVHMLDQTLFLMGFPEIQSVNAATYRKFDKAYVPDIPMDVEDFAIAMVRFANGAVLEMEISWASHHDHPEEMRVQLYGSKGGALRCTRDYRETLATVQRLEHDRLVTVNMDRSPKISTVQADLIEAVHEGREPLCSGRQGLMCMRILDAIYQSAAEGREVRLD